jgi:hypothetical protein
VPVSNPDGFQASRVSGDVFDLRQVDDGGIVSILGTPGNAYKRKNCRYIDGQSQPAGTCVAIPSLGGFTYHANPSTRPFVQSRKATVLGEPKDSLSSTGNAAPFGAPVDTPFEVTEPADVLRASVRTAFPVDGQVVNYRQFTVQLRDAGGNVVAEARDFGPVNTLSWSGPGGAGVPAGTYTLRVVNSLGVTLAYNLEAATHDVLGDRTPRQFEQWTLTCTNADGSIAGQQLVSVERGQSFDVGDVCGAGGKLGGMAQASAAGGKALGRR